MRSLMGAGAIALTLIGSAAYAQTTTETTTSQYSQTPAPMPPAAAPVAPPMGTLSTTREQHAVDAYGDRSDSRSTSYRDSTGVAEQSESRTVTAPPPPPPPPPMTTTTTTTESSTTEPR